MNSKYVMLWIVPLLVVLIAALIKVIPQLQEPAGIIPPETIYSRSDNSSINKPGSNDHPEWRPAQVIEGVTIDAAPSCEPDNPYDIVTSVKGKWGQCTG